MLSHLKIFVFNFLISIKQFKLKQLYMSLKNTSLKNKFIIDDIYYSMSSNSFKKLYT